MNALTVYNVSKTVKDQPLFENVSFGMEAGEKLGILGKNGVGKSTLLKIIDGTVSPDDGQITVNSSMRIARLDQDVSFDDETTLDSFLFLCSDERIALLRSFETGKENDSQKLEDMGAWEIRERYRRFLTELGVRCPLDSRMRTLSGGMRKKASIARLLSLDNQIMLLDEPTNHLDIPAIEWLENYLFAKNCTVILVTHDRYFLDRICSRIVEIDRRKAYFYEGGYTQFLTQREERLNAMQKEQDRLTTILRRELEWLRQGPKARTGKDSGRKKRIETMLGQKTGQEADQRGFSSIQRRMGKKILELRNISVRRGDNTLIRDFSLEFVKGQRFGIIGPNGCGKTTLLEVMTGHLDVDKGEVDTGVNTVFGYYDQSSVNLPLDRTPLEFLSDISENIALSSDFSVTPARFLELFGFPSSFHRLPISVLSGGEKRRLYLLSRLVVNPNFLVLDEPTNDLDMDTLRRLEQYVLDFQGCVVCVSHDRAFLDRTCDELIVLPDQIRFEGNYSQWHERELSQKPQAKKEVQSQRPVLREKKGLSFKEQREFEALESTIEQTEDKISDLEAFFSTGSADPSGEKTRQYNALKEELEKYYERWEELTCLM